jgi:hypothetical protein
MPAGAAAPSASEPAPRPSESLSTARLSATPAKGSPPQVTRLRPPDIPAGSRLRPAVTQTYASVSTPREGCPRARALVSVTGPFLSRVTFAARTDQSTQHASESRPPQGLTKTALARFRAVRVTDPIPKEARGSAPNDRTEKSLGFGGGCELGKGQRRETWARRSGPKYRGPRPRERLCMSLGSTSQ